MKQNGQNRIPNPLEVEATFLLAIFVCPLLAHCLLFQSFAIFTTRRKNSKLACIPENFFEFYLF